jgi:hypothetical protein
MSSTPTLVDRYGRTLRATARLGLRASFGPLAEVTDRLGGLLVLAGMVAKALSDRVFSGRIGVAAVLSILLAALVVAARRSMQMLARLTAAIAGAQPARQRQVGGKALPAVTLAPRLLPIPALARA